eukprot:CAMPEP_0177641332 /NCGR_PEP_ID=MMETSP0447-20121125/7008_1 /TAXON_ID=0 /ORGANISM="Stygamoeba regulata, Strain BSH-02190019" /LENGTH=198 /DNA_ID=CAMNT_0019143439 /DNA_START=42 /DNA_END=639 /DNA_ORIENTATION=+
MTAFRDPALPCFPVPAGGGVEKCFREEYTRDSVVIGSFKAPPSADSSLQFKIMDSRANHVWSMNEKDESDFRFTADMSGNYIFCFTDSPKLSITREGSSRLVEFKLNSGVEAKDYTEVATQEHLAPLELEMVKLSELADEINQDFKYFRSRENAMQRTSSSTHSRALWSSLLSLGVLVSLGAAQVYYLKRFFMAKKLI